MKYHRLLARLEGQPLMIAEGKLRIITEHVTIPLMLGKELDDTSPSMSYATSKTVPAGGPKLAVISVFDSLVSKNASAASGMTSYEGIASAIDEAVMRGATEIGFYIDSPGGEVSGLFGLTEKIRGLPAQGISTFSFTDGMMTSAAQAIGAAAQKSYASETALVGSIAAIMVHAESSKADAARGITYEIFRSKEEKALADSKTPLSDAAREKITSMLASMDTAFNNDIVASRPNLTVQAIVDMKGSEFMAETGLKLGLIDGIMANLETVMSTRYKSSTSRKGVKMEEELLQVKAALEAEKTARAAAETALATAQAAIETTRAEAQTAERTRCVAVLKAAPTLRLSPELALEHIEAGYSSEASLAMMTAIATGISAATATNGSVGLQSTLDKGPGGDPVDNTAALASAYKAATGKVLKAQA